ncbi:MAG: hypothetical protein NVSMB1_08040 [Polyangiales bacterium]
MLQLGLTIGQVVHDYGDVCQTITGLALKQKILLSGDEFRTLNLCLDDAIAEAVTEYSRGHERARESVIEEKEIERLGSLAHELRNLLSTATLALESIKSGRVALGGSTGLVLDRSLMGIGSLIDRTLAAVRLDAGIDRSEPISVAELVEGIEVSSSLQAKARDIHFLVQPVDRIVTIKGDWQVIAAALSNLLQNAFKYTRRQGRVSLITHTTADRVLFDVEDECGGLPPGKIENMFCAFADQRGIDRSGMGLGLSISMKAAIANGGELHVRDLPGKGCIFTLDLPRVPPPPLSLVRDSATSPASPEGTVNAKSDGSETPKARARA